MEFSGNMIARPIQGDAMLHEYALVSMESYDLVEHFSDVDEFILRVPEGMTENMVAANLMATGAFEYVEPDWTCFIVNEPNDPMFDMQLWHRNIQSKDAWDIRTGDSTYIAAYVDSGIDLNHPDLKSSLVSGFNSVSNKAQSNGGDVSDQNGHGTNCAGCIGAIGDNGKGVVGVCWDVKIMPIKTTSGSGGSSSMSNLTQGARWAADNGAGSVSVSFSGVESSSVRSAGDYCDGKDCILLWAAGNSDTNLSGFDWSKVEIVGATDVNDNKANFSSYGKAVDVMAPGVNITTTARNQTYNSVSGTSFATPITNGVVSMIRMEYPSWSTAQVRQRLYDACDDMGNSTKYGHGRVNLYKSLGGGPAGGLTLSFANLSAGSTATLSVEGAPASSTVYFAYSLLGSGSTSIPSLGVTLDMASPALAGTGTANASGTASMNQAVPASAQFVPIWLQAAVTGDISPVVPTVIM
jgi:subtilisin family serine protease